MFLCGVGRRGAECEGRGGGRGVTIPVDDLREVLGEEIKEAEINRFLFLFLG